VQGTIYHQLGSLAVDRSRPEEALPHLRLALAAFQRARDEHGQTRVLNALGNVEFQRENEEAALAWYDRSLELATRLGNVEEQAWARSNRAAVFSVVAEKEADPLRTRQLLDQALAEARAALVLREQLGQPATIAISHNNLGYLLRCVGALDEAEEHAHQALAIRQQIGDHETWKTLWLLEGIAEARGDAAAAAEWRRRKEAARVEAETRSGDLGMLLNAVSGLLQVAMQVRTAGTTLEQALATIGAPDGFLAALAGHSSWLVAHLQALATDAARPDGDVPAPYRDLVAQAWRQVQSP
jgi:tetratricopeptide (TPR) repeat protein